MSFGIVVVQTRGPVPVSIGQSPKASVGSQYKAQPVSPHGRCAKKPRSTGDFYVSPITRFMRAATYSSALPCPGVFKPVWRPALVQQSPPAIILAALLRFGGPALFHGPRTSSRLGTPFWLSGLTLRSSRPAYGGRLIWAVRRLFAGGLQRSILSSKHRVGFGNAKRSWHGCLSALFFWFVWWPLHATRLAPSCSFQFAQGFGVPPSNPAVKRTGLQPAAYLVPWAS